MVRFGLWVRTDSTTLPSSIQAQLQPRAGRRMRNSHTVTLDSPKAGRKITRSTSHSSPHLIHTLQSWDLAMPAFGSGNRRSTLRRPAPQHYIAAGSQTLGGASGWDSTLDIQTFRDYRGNTIDLNNDGIADFVGMGPNGLEYAYGQYTAGATPGSQVYSLGTIQKGASDTNIDFGRDQGWDTSTSERIIADINGDGRVDILAFGDAGVWASLGQQANPDGSGAFGAAYLAMGDYGTQQGWSTAVNTRVLGDIYGNGQVDIIGFGADYTFVATPTTDPTTGHVTFAMTENWHAYGTNEGYTPAQNFRGVADVTGTGIDSIVVSSATNTQILTHV